MIQKITLVLILSFCLPFAVESSRAENYSIVHSFNYNKEQINVYKVDYQSDTAVPYFDGAFENLAGNISPTTLVWKKGASDFEPFLVALQRKGSPSAIENQLVKITSEGNWILSMDHKAVMTAEGPEGSLYTVDEHNQIYQTVFKDDGSYKTEKIYFIHSNASGFMQEIQVLDSGSFLMRTEKHIQVVKNDGNGYQRVKEFYVPTVSDISIQKIVGNESFLWIQGALVAGGGHVAYLLDWQSGAIVKRFTIGPGDASIIDMNPTTLDLEYRKEKDHMRLSASTLQETKVRAGIFSMSYLAQHEKSVNTSGVLETHLAQSTAKASKRSLYGFAGAVAGANSRNPVSLFDFKQIFNRELSGKLKRPMTLEEFTNRVNQAPGISIHLYFLNSAKLKKFGLERRLQWLLPLPKKAETLLDVSELQQMVSELAGLMVEGRCESLLASAPSK